MALDVESFIGQHGLDRPTLIGHSMQVVLLRMILALDAKQVPQGCENSFDSCPSFTQVGIQCCGGR